MMRALSSAVLLALGASVVGVLVLGLVGTAPAASPQPAEKIDELVVALHLPAPGLQVGAVRGHEVVAAAGLEVDVARALATRLGVHARFVNVASPGSLLRPRPGQWDAAVGGIEARARSAGDLSAPYLRTDPVVLMRAGLPPPRTLADLRLRLLCAVTGSRGAAAMRRVRTAFSPVLVRTDAELLELLQTGRCDAAVREAPKLGVALGRLGGRYGPIGGRIDTGASWVLVLPRGSALRARIDHALGGLRANGTLGRISQRWLGFEPSRLRVLR